MARKVFFSFHYERDVWRANVVRNSWVPKDNYIKAGFIDSAEFEKIKKKGDQAIKKWIDEQLEGTSVTVVLIGAETYSRKWIRYEIIKSFDRSNGLLGVYIHNIKDENGKVDLKGPNPFNYVAILISKNGDAYYYEWNGSDWIEFSLYPKCSLTFDEEYWTGKLYTIKPNLYDWVDDNGYENLSDWIEESARKAGR
jgi:hypothetical protein